MVALEMANHILLVTQLDLPCLRNVVRLMMSFNEMEGIGEKVKIVVNRAGLDNGHITLKKAEETIGKEIFWQLPNDYRTMIEARNNGVPLDRAVAQGGHHAVRSRGWPRPCSTTPSPKTPAAGKKSSGIGGLFSRWSGKGK